jgi:hypothetical protein
MILSGQSEHARAVLPALHRCAPRWLPRVFRNLGRGIF